MSVNFGQSESQSSAILSGRSIDVELQLETDNDSIDRSCAGISTIVGARSLNPHHGFQHADRGIDALSPLDILFESDWMNM